VDAAVEAVGHDRRSMAYAVDLARAPNLASGRTKPGGSLIELVETWVSTSSTTGVGV
jgi:hypothetical protein